MRRQDLADQDTWIGSNGNHFDLITINSQFLYIFKGWISEWKREHKLFLHYFYPFFYKYTNLQ